MSWIGRWNGVAYFAPLVLATARLDLVPVVTVPLMFLAGAVAWLLVASTLVSIADRAAAAGSPHRAGAFVSLVAPCQSDALAALGAARGFTAGSQVHPSAAHASPYASGR